MRLARVGHTGAETPVAGTTDGRWYDLREITRDVDDVRAWATDQGLARLLVRTLSSVRVVPQRSRI